MPHLKTLFLNRSVKIIACLYCSVLLSPLHALEGPPVVHVSEVIPTQFARSLEHRVEDVSLSDSYLEFYIETDINTFYVQSIPLLRKRVQEMNVLARAKSESGNRQEEEVEYTAGQYRISADSAVDIISRPVELAGWRASGLPG